MHEQCMTVPCHSNESIMVKDNNTKFMSYHIDSGLQEKQIRELSLDKHDDNLKFSVS